MIGSGIASLAGAVKIMSGSQCGMFEPSAALERKPKSTGMQNIK
jgi:hypothetical protein